jgi:hypothetical protein
MRPPHGTSIVDISDPAKPRIIAEIPMQDGMHSHKVQVSGDIMITNREIYPTGSAPGPDFPGGFDVWNISDPASPKKLTTWHARGMHRFIFDGRYLYGSPEVKDYVGNIMMILDLEKPDKPQEVGRWWMPGQWEAGGEDKSWEGRDHRCHHPMRLGDRLYVSYWHGGFVILDIEDMSKPEFISGLDWSPPFPWPTHTALPIPFDIRGRRILLVADEDVVRRGPDIPAWLWLVDITDETRPTPFATFQIDEQDGSPVEDYTGLHQFCEEVRGTEIPMAWFAHGLKIVDIANPHAPKEVASFLPPPAKGSDRVQSNDVCYDERGLIYLIDRIGGVHIVERI